MNMIELIQAVEEWSKEKNLNNGDSAKQFLKTAEEFGEVASALARNDQEELKDGIGDVFVTLIILAQQNNLTAEECLEQAYNVISKRTGKTINGIFIKQEDLDKQSKK